LNKDSFSEATTLLSSVYFATIHSPELSIINHDLKLSIPISGCNFYNMYVMTYMYSEKNLVLIKHVVFDSGSTKVLSDLLVSGFLLNCSAVSEEYMQVKRQGQMMITERQAEENQG